MKLSTFSICVPLLCCAASTGQSIGSSDRSVISDVDRAFGSQVEHELELEPLANATSREWFGRLVSIDASNALLVTNNSSPVKVTRQPSSRGFALTLTEYPSETDSSENSEKTSARWFDERGARPGVVVALLRPTRDGGRLDFRCILPVVCGNDVTGLNETLAPSRSVMIRQPDPQSPRFESAIAAISLRFEGESPRGAFAELGHPAATLLLGTDVRWAVALLGGPRSRRAVRYLGCFLGCHSRRELRVGAEIGWIESGASSRDLIFTTRRSPSSKGGTESLEKLPLRTTLTLHGY